MEEEPSGTFVVADIFDRSQIERIEKLMRTYFKIEKKELTTINVKCAMSLDKPRIEGIV